MIKKLLTYLLICIFILSGPYCVIGAAADTTQTDASAREDLSVLEGSHTISAKHAILGSGQLVKNVDAAFMYEVQSDTLMYAWNADVRMYPASLVKMLTALIAIEQGDLSDIVTVKESVISTLPDDAVSSSLQADEQISLIDLLYCMMVDSANDAAAVIADYISGSQRAFIELMNQYAAELGCSDTNFTNVHGLHDEQQYTTARDIAKILSVAIKNESFKTLFSTVQYTVPATNKYAERKLTTGNYLMTKPDGMDIYFDARVIGGRTGVTEDGSRCLAVYAEENGLQLISIIMGSKSVYEDDGYTVRSFGGFKETSSLLDHGFDGYQYSQILVKDQSIRQISVINGNDYVTLCPEISAATVLPINISSSQLTYRYLDAGEVSAPVKRGDKLSSVQVWYRDICIAQADLYAMNAVTLAAPLQFYDGSNNGIGAGTVLLTVFIILIICAVAFAIWKYQQRIRYFALKFRSHKGRKERRRNR